MKIPYYTKARYIEPGKDRKSETTYSVEDIQLPLSARLLRNYLDLGPLADGPLYAYGLERAYEQLIEGDSIGVPSQTHPSVMLRQTLTDETGLTQYNVSSPSDLPCSLYTERWQNLVEKVELYQQLSLIQKVRVVILLDRLCFQSTITRLVPAVTDTEISSDAQMATLAVIRAKSVHHIKPTDKNRQAYLDILGKVALTAPSHYTRLGAALNLIVQNSKTRNRNLTAARYWSEVAHQNYQVLHPEDGGLDSLYVSTYWRAVSFIPFITGDKAVTKAQLDLAETYAYSFKSDTEANRVASTETIHPLLETRTKEALWLGDLDLALERSQALAEYDPFDPKVHIELGDVLLTRNQIEDALKTYREAARLGAPYTSFSWFMIGYCLEALDDLNHACDAYVQALEFDPQGITPAQSLIKVAKRTGQVALANWGEGLLEKLRQHR